jgi:hypothetical protein
MTSAFCGPGSSHLSVWRGMGGGVILRIGHASLRGLISGSLAPPFHTILPGLKTPAGSKRRAPARPARQPGVWAAAGTPGRRADIVRIARTSVAWPPPISRPSRAPSPASASAHRPAAARRARPASRRRPRRTSLAGSGGDVVAGHRRDRDFQTVSWCPQRARRREYCARALRTVRLQNARSRRGGPARRAAAPSAPRPIGKSLEAQHRCRAAVSPAAANLCRRFPADGPRRRLRRWCPSPPPSIGGFASLSAMRRQASFRFPGAAAP